VELFHLETAVKVLKLLERVLAVFSKCAYDGNIRFVPKAAERRAANQNRSQQQIGSLASRWRCGQAHCKHRALAWLARHRHVATHHACELAGYGKAQPRAAEALSGRGIGLAELLEQLGLLLRCHADAGVGDGELDVAAAIAHLACRKLDLARFSELARVAKEVEQDLPQPHGVHGQCAEVLSGVFGVIGSAVSLIAWAMVA